MAKSAAPKQQTLTVPVSVLGIDSNWEAATLAAYQYREKQVYPYIASKGYAVDKCQGPMAKRIYVAPKAQQPGVAYLTGVGHGSYTTYTGHYSGFPYPALRSKPRLRVGLTVRPTRKRGFDGNSLYGAGTATVTKEKQDVNALHGAIKNGQIVLDEPAELPEGSRVEVLPVEAARPMLGMREEDWPTTPEGIAALLARMDQVEPGWLSPEDDAAWRATLRARKDVEKARFFEDADALRRMWE
jgi:hypothetical protein